eukprot:TRINITY_DN5891_c0_g1_i1.p1 TRINITY_DN5891_c0_g1~~TRINITY_DN5891_c0_g1_i1.p1  ORF type:complete len:198 (+),score=45.78 TRINITY_DN5891_c0_g1_i1:55-648(+)
MSASRPKPSLSSAQRNINHAALPSQPHDRVHRSFQAPSSPSTSPSPSFPSRPSQASGRTRSQSTEQRRFVSHGGFSVLAPDSAKRDRILEQQRAQQQQQLQQQQQQQNRRRVERRILNPSHTGPMPTDPTDAARRAAERRNPTALRHPTTQPPPTRAQAAIRSDATRHPSTLQVQTSHPDVDELRRRRLLHFAQSEG